MLDWTWFCLYYIHWMSVSLSIHNQIWQIYKIKFPFSFHLISSTLYINSYTPTAHRATSWLYSKFQRCNVTFEHSKKFYLNFKKQYLASYHLRNVFVQICAKFDLNEQRTTTQMLPLYPYVDCWRKNAAFLCSKLSRFIIIIISEYVYFVYRHSLLW